MIKQLITLLTFLLCINFSYSQSFTSENGSFIDLNQNVANLNIDNSSYTGTFQSFNSKKDKQEYLIYPYFSRTIIFTIDRPLSEINNNTTEINLTIVMLIHSKEINSIIDIVSKKGINNLKNYIIIYQSTKITPMYKSST